MNHIDITDKKYTQYSKPYPRAAIDAVDAISKLEGPARWRMSAAVCLNVNPIDEEDGLTAKEQYMAAKADAKEKRSNLKTRFGEITPGKAGTVGGSSTVRDQLVMPALMWNYIKMFDMISFAQNNPDAKNNLNKLRQEFKELSVAEAF